MRVALVDSDTMVFWAAYFSQKDIDEGKIDPEDHNLIAQMTNGHLKTQMKNLKDAVQADEYIWLIGGTGNYRSDLDPEYKAGRPDKPSTFPIALDYIKSKGAVWKDGYEADDLLGIARFSDKYKDDDVVMCHIDKDLDMLHGTHYDYKAKKWYEVSELEAYRNFAKQCLSGDSTDNIKGLKKLVGKVATAAMKAPLDHMYELRVMLDYVYALYMTHCPEDNDPIELIAQMNVSAKCLWICRDWQDKDKNWFSDFFYGV